MLSVNPGSDIFFLPLLFYLFPATGNRQPATILTNHQSPIYHSNNHPSTLTIFIFFTFYKVDIYLLKLLQYVGTYK
jgi:hypothetical protein